MQFPSNNVDFRSLHPAHSQAFSGPLHIGQNGKRLQTSTAPSTDYAFEVQCCSSDIQQSPVCLVSMLHKQGFVKFKGKWCS